MFTIQLYPLAVIIIGAISLTAGDVVFKYWLVYKGGPLYLVGFLLYAFGLVCVIESFKYENIAVASAMIVLFNISMLTLVSWVYFQEIPTSLALVGLAIGAIALVLLELG